MNYTNIKDEDIRQIKHTCETILTYDNKPWMKKDNNDKFDVPMVSFFGAELCDLIGLYSLKSLNHLYNHNEIGLYIYDILATINRKNKQELERLKRKQ